MPDTAAGAVGAVTAPRFCARWVSPHGGVSVFLGLSADPEEARALARRELVRCGLGRAESGIEVVPVPWLRLASRAGPPRAA
jgi:hypothetical protein